MTGGLEAMLPVIEQMSADFQLNGKAKEKLKDIFRTWFNEDINHSNIMNEIKGLYSQNFTNDEITKITAFYQTDVGKKFLEKSVQLMKMGAEISKKEAHSKKIKLMERIKPFLEKHGIKQ